MEKIMWSLTERVVLDSRCGKPYICMIIKEPHDRAVIIIITQSDVGRSKIQWQ